MPAPGRPEWLPFQDPATPSARRNMFAVCRPGPPRSVRWAVVLMVLRALVVAVSTVALYQQRDVLRDKIVARYPDLTASTATTLVHIMLVASIVGAGLWSICYLYLAARVRRGGNTARVIAIALAVLAIVGAGYALVHTTSGLLQGALLADAVCDVGIIALLTATDSWDYSNRYRAA
ncbi:MAG TPA: hypothetical protein VFE19_10685 [Jatrophihabitantaceae bacterium]|nr:hypothetical protein [Jatrophihabitantaceae bacterium]